MTFKRAPTVAAHHLPSTTAPRLAHALVHACGHPHFPTDEGNTAISHVARAAWCRRILAMLSDSINVAAE